MKTYPAIIVASLLLAFVALSSLIAAAPYLQVILPGGLPLGNALAAAGLCSASLAAYLLTLRQNLLRSVAMLVLLASLVWLPVSIALAGNLALNFAGETGSAWLTASAILLLSVILTLLLAIAYSVVAWYKRRRAT